MVERQPGPLKRYLLFCVTQYYPAGGWGDFEGDFDTVEEAKSMATKTYHDDFHIIDITTGEDVVVE